jgi:membrane protease YdiL (CAAX protease family)
MEDSKPDAGNVGIGGQIVTWVVLLFVLILLCLLPFLIGGVSISGLGKLSPSSALFALCIAGFTFVGYTPTLSALPVAGFFPGGGGARSVLRQVRTWRVGIGWHAIAVFGPAVLFLLDEAVNLVLGGSPPQHWIVLPSIAGFFPGSLFFSVMGVLAGTIGEEFGWRGFAQPRLQKRYGALKASISSGSFGARFIFGFCRFVTA